MYSHSLGYFSARKVTGVNLIYKFIDFTRGAVNFSLQKSGMLMAGLVYSIFNLRRDGKCLPSNIDKWRLGPCTPKNCILYITEKGGILVLGICILYINLQSEYFGILLSLKLRSTEWASKYFFLKNFAAHAAFLLSLYTPSCWFWALRGPSLKKMKLKSFQKGCRWPLINYRVITVS